MKLPKAARTVCLIEGSSIMMKKIQLAGALLATVLALTACGSSTQGAKIAIEGSTSMQKLVQELADTYTAKNPGVTIEITADGSSAGIKAAGAGTTDIGMSSRAIKDEEKSTGLVEKQLAWDAIAVIVHPDNPVKDLTVEQLAQIYTKQVTNWKDLGGADSAIVVVARDTSSGTREAFDTLTGTKDAVKADQEAAKTGEVKTVVAQNPNAIGYLSLPYVDATVKALNIGGVTPSEATVGDGTYIMKRPFVLVTKGDPNPAVKAFYDFISSDDGTAIIAKEALPVK